MGCPSTLLVTTIVWITDPYNALFITDLDGQPPSQEELQSILVPTDSERLGQVTSHLELPITKLKANIYWPALQMD